MDLKFASLVERLHPLFTALVAGPPITKGKSVPLQGVYLFSEGTDHLYVGRSNRMPARFRDHRSANHKTAAFAFILACETFGRGKASYKPEGSRDALMQVPAFRAAFDNARERIRRMDFRAVEENDQTCQTLLEVYCAVALGTPHNDFRTH